MSKELVSTKAPKQSQPSMASTPLPSAPTTSPRNSKVMPLSERPRHQH